MASRTLILQMAALVMAAGATVLAPEPGVAQRSDGPFAGLSGSWTGSGTVTLSSGTDERLRCRASYDVENAGNSVKLRLRCASDSYRFDLNGTVISEGGRLGGTWNEATRQVSGSVSGSASADHVQARIAGPNFTANMAISTRGKRTQSVTITSPGTALNKVALTMNRSGS